MWLKILLIIELALVFALGFIINMEYFDKSMIKSAFIGLIYTASFSFFVIDYIRSPKK